MLRPLARRESELFSTTVQGFTARPQPDVAGPLYSAGVTRMQEWSEIVSRGCSALSIINGRFGEVVDSYTSLVFGRRASAAMPVTLASLPDEAIDVTEEMMAPASTLPAVIPTKVSGRSASSGGKAKTVAKHTTSRGGKRGRRTPRG